MDDDDILERLVEMLSAFFTEGIAVEEDLTYSLTSEFLRNIQDVLYTKQLVLFSRMEAFFDINCGAMLASTEMYLRHVIYACLQISRENKFEGFLGVFALILRSSLEMRFRTQTNFCNLVPDVFMVFYKNVLKKTFSDGFLEFVKHINNPGYLEEKCIVRNILDSYDHNASVSEISKDLRQKVFRMMCENEDLLRESSFVIKGAVMHKYSLTLAKKVLKTTKIKPFLKPREQKIPKAANRPTLMDVMENLIYSELTSECCPTLPSHSITNDDAAVQMTDDTRYENIIESVIRYNHSQSSYRVKTKGRIPKEVNRNLEHLKSTINSLIEVLDEYGKE